MWVVIFLYGYVKGWKAYQAQGLITVIFKLKMTAFFYLRLGMSRDIIDSTSDSILAQEECPDPSNMISFLMLTSDRSLFFPFSLLFFRFR